MVGDDYADFVGRILEKLARELTPVFGLAAVRSKNLWKAVRHKPDDPRRKGIEWAKYCFEFNFPKPSNKGKADLAIDAYQPAVWAFCAGLEYLRTNDPALDSVMTDMLAKWGETKRIISTEKSFKGSENSASQPKKVVWEKIKPQLEAGKSPKEIAHSLGVCAEAVRRVARKHGWSKEKTQPP